MADSDIDEVFQQLFSRFGREEVIRRLLFLIENADPDSKDSIIGSSKGKKKRTKSKSAIEYVDAMEMPRRRKGKLRELAKKFDEKEFLPRVGDMRDLFYTHGADVSSIGTRSASMPRVFFFLSTLSEERLNAIIDDNSYSGPRQLESLSNAIKRRRKDYERSVVNDGSSLDDQEESPNGS